MRAIPKEEYTTAELIEEARAAAFPMSGFTANKFEKLRILQPSVDHKMGPGGKIYNRRDVANCLRVLALSAVGYTPRDAARYANQVRLFRKITAPYLKSARTEPLDAVAWLFVPEDIFPNGDPANIDWSRMMPEVAEKAFDLLEAIASEVLTLMGRIDRMRKALSMMGEMEMEMKDRLMPAIGKAYEERGDMTASLRKFTFDSLWDQLLGKEKKAGKK